MSANCPVCNAFVDERGSPAGAMVRCDACGARFKLPRLRRGERAQPHEDDGGLGIHPALARRYQTRQYSDEGDPVPAPPASIDDDLPGDLDELESVQLSPSLLNEKGLLPEAPVNLEDVVARGQEKRGNTRPIADAKTTAARSPRPEREEKKKPEVLPEIPGYDVHATVGKGAMGRVYRATRRINGDVAAVKVLAPELAARPDFVARFEREAAALRAVDHDGVVSILESGSHGDTHYLSMRFVEGKSLRRSLDDGPLNAARALDFARQIAQGLAAAHDAGVIHRDLKPENILVQQLALEGGGTRERLVLVDFGLAGMAEETDPHPNLTKSRMTMGTVNYMAPEQRTDAKRVDARADIYASGVILYELLTGDLPLGRFKLPTERGLVLPASVDEVLARTLDRERDRRPATAQDFDALLHSLEVDLEKVAVSDTLIGKERAEAVKHDADTSPSVDQAVVNDEASLSDLLSETAVHTELDTSPAFPAASKSGDPQPVAPGQARINATVDTKPVAPADAADDSDRSDANASSAFEVSVLGTGEARSRVQDQAGDSVLDGFDAHSSLPSAVDGFSAGSLLRDRRETKRLLMIVGGIAIGLGLVVGIWRAVSGPDAASDTSAPSASTGERDPPETPTFRLAAPAWTQDSDGRVRFSAKASPAGDAPSLAVLSTSEAGPGLEAQTTLHLKSRAAAPKPKDGEVVTVSEGYGGIFFVDESRARVVGVAVVQSGQVRFVETGPNVGVKTRMTSLSADPNAPVKVRLLCSTAQRSCKVRVGKGEVGPIATEVLKDGAWSLALGCRDVDCAFENARIGR